MKYQLALSSFFPLYFLQIRCFRVNKKDFSDSALRDITLDANLLNQCFKYHFRQLNILEIINNLILCWGGAGHPHVDVLQEMQANLGIRAMDLFCNYS